MNIVSCLAARRLKKTDSSFLIGQLTMRSGSNASRGIYRVQAIRIKHHAQGRFRHAITPPPQIFRGPLSLDPILLHSLEAIHRPPLPRLSSNLHHQEPHKVLQSPIAAMRT